MTPHEWEALKKETSDALEGGEAKSERVRELLGHREAAEGFLEQPALAQVANSWIGRPIGPYRVVRKIAAGGMSVVYLAERADGAFERQVAVKLIRPLCDCDEFVVRFDRERRLLALLDHPNIARLIDGGTTGDGFSYIAMEYVDGVPVDEFARGLRDIEARLRLFLQILSAVDHAHRHLVVHRDLKPSNVLVTHGGVPKLLDFGIARLMDEGGGARTQTAYRLMTPRYASPEQFRGEAVSVATDIYSLGVMLHELLTGASPYGDKASTTGLRTAVCEGSIAKTTLASDLDSILGKAMRKDPRERYPSIAAFGADLERFLERRPVEAQPAGRMYRAFRFVQRNSIGAAAGIAAFALLAGASATAIYQARRADLQRLRAERRFEQVRNLAGSVLFDFEAKLTDVPGSLSIQREMIAKAKSYLESLQGDGPPDESLSSEIASAYSKLALAQEQLNQRAEARQSAMHAVGLLEELVARHPRDIELARRMAMALYARAGLSGPGEAIADLRGAIPLLEQVCQSNCTPAVRDSLASVYARLSSASEAVGRLGDARGYMRKELAELAMADPFSRQQSLPVLLRVGVLQSRLGDEGGAESSFLGAIAAVRQRLSRNPGDVTTSKQLAEVLEKLAQVQERRMPEAALRTFEEATGVWRHLAAAEPRDTRARSLLAESLEHLGAAQRNTGRLAAAGRTYLESLAIRRTLLADNLSEPSLKRRVSISLHGVADVAFSQGRYADAARHYGEAARLRHEIHLSMPGEARARIDLAVSWASLGKTAEAMGDRRAALRHYLASVDVREPLLALQPKTRVPQRDLLARVAALQRGLGDAAIEQTISRIGRLDRLDSANVAPAPADLAEAARKTANAFR